MAERVGHEQRDANVKLITWFAVGLVVCAIIIHLVTGWLYKVFKDDYPSPDAPSRIALDAKPIAPAPQLQTNAQVDLAKYEDEENKKLNSYGWLDKRAGVIHVPIERAIDLLVQRGLPTRGPGTNNSSGITPEQLQQQKAAATAPKP